MPAAAAVPGPDPSRSGDADPLGPVALAARHDPAAAQQLVLATQGDVWRLCRLLGDPDTAEDLVQETYLRAFRALASFRGEAPVRLWLLSIARRVAADQVRRETRRRALDAVLRRERTGHATAVGEVEDLHDAVRRLPSDLRAAFVLTQVLGLAYAEAAEVAGCPIGTIRSRVARARERLVSALG